MTKDLIGFIYGPALRAAFPFMSKGKDGRFYLQGVHIQAHPEGGVLLSATDGHAACRIWDGESNWPFEPATIQLTPETLKALGASKKITPPTLFLRAAPGEFKGTAQATIAATGSNPTVAMEDMAHPVRVGVTDDHGRGFPDLERVFPHNAKGDLPAAFCCIKPSQLARFEVAAGELTQQREPAISLFKVDEGSPYIVSIVGAPRFVGLLMPVKPENMHDAKPDWANVGLCTARKNAAKAKAA